MNKKRFVVSFSVITSIIVILVLLGLWFFLNKNVVLAGIVAGVFIVVLLIIYYFLDYIRSEDNRQIEKNLNASMDAALTKGEIGILSYNDEYEITFMSKFFAKRNLEHLEEKILNWLPELQDIIEGKNESKTIIINDEKYLVSKLDNTSILTFKDISVEYDLKNKLNEDSYVLGLVSYDNYDEASMSEDDLSYVNSNIKVVVIDYFKKFNVVYKTLKNDRMLLIMNESIFKDLLNDRFSILNTIRDLSKQGEVNVTLTLAFARGSDDYNLLDTTVLSLLELGQTRGGDQVVVKKIGEDTNFYGGLSEAREKQSKTRVRITANSIKDLINKSSNVIIVGHRNMDADCVGAAIGMSNFAKSLDKEAYIVAKYSDMEKTIGDIYNKYKDILDSKHNFVYESEALDELDDDSLVIMVDHNMMEQSASANILRNAKRILIIDHHRRKADLDVSPLMVNIEASASSTSEIVLEFLPYLSKHLEITSEEANIMYLGILIDTDNFRVRTGSRTFEVLKQLRRLNADPNTCNELMQEPYEYIKDRSVIIHNSKMYNKDIIVSVNDNIFDRTTLSKAVDEMIKAKDIKAAFAICNLSSNETIISARSNGEINVQIIMEKMNGGGHMMAAGLQRSDTNVNALYEELTSVIDEYLKGEDDESNTNSWCSQIR